MRTTNEQPAQGNCQQYEATAVNLAAWRALMTALLVWLVAVFVGIPIGIGVYRWMQVWTDFWSRVIR